MVLLRVLKYVTRYVCEVTRYVIHVTRNLNNRKVLLHVKRERVRVTSDSGAQIATRHVRVHQRGFATRRDVSADKQAHRYQQMPRHQSINHIRKQK